MSQRHLSFPLCHVVCERLSSSLLGTNPPTSRSARLSWQRSVHASISRWAKMPSASPAGALPFFPDPQHAAHSPGPVPTSASPSPALGLTQTNRADLRLGPSLADGPVLLEAPRHDLMRQQTAEHVMCGAQRAGERTNKHVSERRLQWLLLLLLLYLMTFKVQTTAGLQDYRSVRAAEGSVRRVKGVT